ncbi:MAG: hypothetical protein EBT70_08985 [Betaproteobacteria bacterium]|nr:hypothetical protein [Betaproteobacteria bacterium]
MGETKRIGRWGKFCAIKGLTGSMQASVTSHAAQHRARMRAQLVGKGWALFHQTFMGQRLTLESSPFAAAPGPAVVHRRPA